MRILGIETSCDETGIAIYDEEQGILANQLYSQSSLHADYGGVVPELASRDHINKTLPLIQATLKEARLKKTDIDGIAYTAGPGLIGSLLVGAAIGRALAFAWRIPAVAVHHMEGHLLAPMLEKNVPEFPFVALLVSGGHTQLVHALKLGKYVLLGESVDDAVGEVFDKIAKLLGFDYPGGAALSRFAQRGCEGQFNFPRPMIDNPSLDFSFSGLKTAVVRTIQQCGEDVQKQADIARAFEEAVVSTLVIKCSRALEKTKCFRLVIGGGVSANRRLRDRLKKLLQKIGGEFFCARPEFCVDNGAMIAYTGTMYLKNGIHSGLSIEVYPRWQLPQADSGFV